MVAKQNLVGKSVGSNMCSVAVIHPQQLGCYMVKPHGPLVRVSFIHYCMSTARLSTLWSTTDLQAS